MPLLAVKALRKLRKENPKLSSVEFWDETGTKGPVYSTVSPGSGTEPVLILGNQSAYRDVRSGNSYLAWIATRQGDVLHAWRDPGEIWAPLQGRKAVGDKWRSYPVGAHLYPNGDLLVSFQGVGVFPYAMGLAKFDKDSRLIWKNPDLLHHWFSVGAGGEIYIPRRKAAMSPLPARRLREKDSLRRGDLWLRRHRGARSLRQTNQADRHGRFPGSIGSRGALQCVH